MKKALVTGASEGIGRALAIRLAEQGYAVTAVARNEARLNSLLPTLAGSGHKVFVADLSTASGTQALLAKITSEKFELLINNAGFGRYGRFHQGSLEEFENMMRLNCDALVALSHAFLKNAVEGDALVNVASTAAFHPFPLNAVYGATKAFVLSFSEALWYEQQERGVYVMALCPGYTQTEFGKRAGKAEGKRYESFAQTADEVALTGVQALNTRSSCVVVSGLKNTAMTVLAQHLLPRKTAVTLAGRTFRKYLGKGAE